MLLFALLLTLGRVTHALRQPAQGPLPPILYQHLTRATAGECTEDPQGSHEKKMVYTCVDDGVKIVRYAEKNCGGGVQNAQTLDCNMEGCTAPEHDYHITGLKAKCVSKEDLDNMGVDTADIDFTVPQVLVYTHKGFREDMPGFKECPPEKCTLVHAQGHHMMIPVEHEGAVHKLMNMHQGQSRVYNTAKETAVGGDQGKSWEELHEMTKQMGEEGRKNTPRRRMRENDMWNQGITPKVRAMRTAAQFQTRRNLGRYGPDSTDQPISEDVGSCDGDRVWHLATELTVALARLHPVILFFEVGIKVVKKEGCKLADKYCENPWVACWYGPLACIVSYAGCALEGYVCPRRKDVGDFTDIMKSIARTAKKSIMEAIAKPIGIIDSFLNECVDFKSRYWVGTGMEVFIGANLFLVEGAFTAGAGIDADGKYALYVDAAGNIAGITDIVDFEADKLQNFAFSVEAGVNVIFHLRAVGDIAGWGIGHSLSKTMNFPCIPANCVGTISLDAGMACTDWPDAVAGFLGGSTGSLGVLGSLFAVGAFTWDDQEEALYDPSGRCKLNQISIGLAGGIGGTMEAGPPAYSLSGGYTYTIYDSDLKEDWRAMSDFVNTHAKLEEVDLETLGKLPCDEREKTIGAFDCGEAKHCGPFQKAFETWPGECWDGYYAFLGHCMRCEVNNYDLLKEERKCKNIEYEEEMDDVMFCAAEAIRRHKTTFSFERYDDYGYTGPQMCYIPDEDDTECRTKRDISAHTYKAIYPEFVLTQEWEGECDNWCPEDDCPDWYEQLDYLNQRDHVDNHCAEAARTLGLDYDFDSGRRNLDSRRRLYDNLICVWSYDDETVHTIEARKYSDDYKMVCRKNPDFKEENSPDMEENLHFEAKSEDNQWQWDSSSASSGAFGDSVYAVMSSTEIPVGLYGLAGIGMLAIATVAYKQVKKVLDSEYQPLSQ